MSIVRIDWNPDDKAMRSFGRTLFIGFTIIGLAIWFLGGSFDATREGDGIVWGPLPWFTLVPLAVWMLALAAPKAGKPFYLVWMSIGFVMGTIISTIALAAIYWILFGFISLCFRIMGRDRLGMKPIREGNSTWVDRGAGAIEPERYEHQF